MRMAYFRRQADAVFTGSSGNRKKSCSSCLAGEAFSEDW